MSSNFYKLLEFISLFIIFPLLFLFKILPITFVVPIIWLVCLYTLYIIRSQSGKAIFSSFKREDLKLVLKRFLLAFILLLLIGYLFFEDRLFVFVLNNTKIYVLVMFLYPLLSVIPQEIIFRYFFYFRYENFLYPQALLLINALVFGFVHIIFQNYVAVAFSIIGGYLFMSTYVKSKSLTLASIEHALYGNLIFTIGLGEYFYHGNVH